MSNYDVSKINEINSEIDRQWSLHLISRAAFPSKILDRYPNYVSPGYYFNEGIKLSVKYDRLDEEHFKTLDGIGHWLNQNYVIRLFGVLRENFVDTAGKIDNNDYTKIVANLRHKVGAHSRGKRNPDKDKETTELLQKHFGEGIDRKDVENFNLAINTVLNRLKDECKSYVKSLEGKSIPSRGQKKW